MGLGLSHPITNKAIQRSGSQFFKAGCVGVQGYRLEMEDAHSMITNFEHKGRETSLGFFAVYDGHAGDSSAKHIAKELHHKVLDSIPALLPVLDDAATTGAITNAVLEADSLLFEKEKESKKPLGTFGGCTAVFAVCIPISNIYSPVATSAPPSVQTELRLKTKESTGEAKESKDGEDTQAELRPVDAQAEPRPVDRLSTLSLASDGSANATKDVVQEQPTQKVHFFTLIVGNLGDSRCLLGRADGFWAALSEDHKPHNPQERGRIVRAGGFVEQNRVDGCLALSRAFGDFAYKSNASLPPTAQKVVAVPDYAIQTICSGDYLILACDGVFDVMTNKQVMEFVHRRVVRAVRNDVVVDPVETMTALVDACISRGSKDNITAMMVLLGDGRGYEPRTEFVPEAMPVGASDQFREAYTRNCELHGFTSDSAAAFVKERDKGKKENRTGAS